ncbi:mast cell protease 2-like isoform X2 [Sardina pilchardus]|uniref:mast cell protease 2-like isoform X2 n=1 Tax=Sardina pilchardus TaxID=27697 RepID=UPI002E108B19
MRALHYHLMLLMMLLLHMHGCCAEKIINGRKVADKDMKFMASVQNNGKHVCGGFVIKPNFVLTAAHCEKGLTGKVSVVLGAHNIRKTEKNKRYYIRKEDRIIHKAYKKVIAGNDIMLLKLSGKIGKDVKTVKIPTTEKTKMNNTTKCLVAGWGKTSKNEPSIQLQVAQVQLIDFPNCQAAWKQKDINKTLPKNVMCAKGFNRNGPSLGDSGGPLVCNGLAVGIVSFNLSEGYRQIIPSVYTQISKFLPWIKSKTGPSFDLQDYYFE